MSALFRRWLTAKQQAKQRSLSAQHLRRCRIILFACKPAKQELLRQLPFVGPLRDETRARVERRKSENTMIAVKPTQALLVSKPFDLYQI
jgi:hypothetical protein